MVNPKIDDRRRLQIIGQAVWGKHWKTPASQALECDLLTIHAWAGTMPRYVGPWNDRRRVETPLPPPDALNELIRVARRRIRELEFAIDEIRLRPWIDG